MSNANNNNVSLFDTVKADAIAKNKTAANYLSQQRQRAALTRLPEFEGQTHADIKALRKETAELRRLIVVTNWLLKAAMVIGVILWIL